MWFIWQGMLFNFFIHFYFGVLYHFRFHFCICLKATNTIVSFRGSWCRLLLEVFQHLKLPIPLLLHNNHWCSIGVSGVFFVHIIFSSLLYAAFSCSFFRFLDFFHSSNFFLSIVCSLLIPLLTNRCFVAGDLSMNKLQGTIPFYLIFSALFTPFLRFPNSFVLLKNRETCHISIWYKLSFP